MYSRRRINAIRKINCVMFKGLAERPRYIYGGSSTSNFIEIRRTHSSLDMSVSSKDDFKSGKSSFFIEWNKDAGQFKIVSKKAV